MSGLAGNEEIAVLEAFQWLETNSADEIDTIDVKSDTESTEQVLTEKTKRPRKPKRRKRALTGVSRQRRAANARERRRIQGVNTAFVELRKILPVFTHDEVSKIDILRLAAKWIAHLTTVLIEDEENRFRFQSPRSMDFENDDEHDNADQARLPADLQEKLKVAKTVNGKEDNFEICFLSEPSSCQWDMSPISFEMDTQYSNVNNNIDFAVNHNMKYTASMTPILQYTQQDNSRACFLSGNGYFNTTGYSTAAMQFGN
ncbi:uncharacterized protein LOC100377639 [Saccoglossus kowalevskii]|uniref:Uncharacterized protein LOC100377639 n=1 Tax=Saccoglossus kowalevskii TaxID=10224 RepID=A0ABM0GWG9_SACKO|nr:PREDICTED: uncharacterized protein LOC100377639 [Saccoglossus kowalevskii]